MLIFRNSNIGTEKGKDRKKDRRRRGKREEQGRTVRDEAMYQ